MSYEHQCPGPWCNLGCARYYDSRPGLREMLIAVRTLAHNRFALGLPFWIASIEIMGAINYFEEAR